MAHFLSFQLCLFCIFSYAMNGLSADKLRVLLHPVPEDLEVEDKDGGELSDELTSRDRDDDDRRRNRDKPNQLELSKENFELNFRHNQVLASLQDGTRGMWKTAQVMYSYPLPHKVRK